MEEGENTQQKSKSQAVQVDIRSRPRHYKRTKSIQANQKNKTWGVLLLVIQFRYLCQAIHYLSHPDYRIPKKKSSPSKSSNNHALVGKSKPQKSSNMYNPQEFMK